jgi:transposase
MSTTISRVSPSSLYQTTVGIDISQSCLDIATTLPCKLKQVPNTASGIKRLVKELQRFAPDLIVFEATGGYERPLATALHTAGLTVHRANPRQVRDFAKASGILAKTDQVDAAVLARYGLTMCPEPTPAPDPAAQSVDDLTDRHRQLTDILTAEKNRLKQAPPLLQPDIQEHIHWLQKKLKELNHKLSKLIQDTPQLRQRSELLRSVPGVGPCTTAILIGSLPELGQLSPKQLAALVGVAPFARDSGHHKGKRSIWGGRANVRRVLYMSVLTCIRRTSVFGDYYGRLRQAGKPVKVALTACIRKLVTILNALVKSNTMWSPEGAGA